MRSDGTGLRQVTRAAKPSSLPAWSPNGRRLVFERYMGESTHYDLFTVNADGTGGGRLTDYGGAELGPDWSPDGRRIVFGSYRYRYDDSSLCTVSQKGTGRSCFGRTSDSVTNDPDFSPDGRRVVYELSSTLSDDSYYISAARSDGKGGARTLASGGERGTRMPPPSPLTAPG